ncbi:MYCBP-associated protein isoform X2 [Heptranchias perlo]|uniref:MYCBP-associated protein isoform X2 n=1 Tax=Heptranchias perlo TaxID=212740 RepID=UPI00355A5AF1
MGSRSGSKSSRRDVGQRTPPDKKKEKKEVEEIIPIKEEPEKDDVLRGEDIMALAIKPEDLSKLHVPRTPLKIIPITSRMLIRKPKPKEAAMVRKLIAKPAPPVDELKTVDYSGPGGPRFDAEGRVLPHSILGSLVDFKHELLARGHSELANTIFDCLPTEARPQELGVYEKKPEGIVHATSQNQDHALGNWQWHMAERKRTQRLISNLLHKPVEDLVMNQSEEFGQTRQQSNLLDQTIAALGDGKGYRIGSEFWSLPPMIGDELSGVESTLTQTERGFPSPIVHIGKPQTIKQETGTDFPDSKKRYGKNKSENVFLKQRLDEMKTVLRQLDFRQPDIDQLEVIGTGRPFSSVSVERFPVEEDQPTKGKETVEPLEEYPDVIEEPIIGPSIMFCGQPARWLNNTTSHKDEIGMIVRLTFEAMAGDRVISCLEVINDGTTVIYYKWKRLPEQEHCVRSPTDSWMQRFYFNTNSGVILPGETVNFPFTFKSPNAGIFTDFWEFCTHPVLLGGSSLQVALWGVTLFADKNESARQQLQQELEKREKMAIIKHLLDEVIAGVRTPQRSQSPIGASFIEEEIFERMNPKLHYKHDVVQSLKELWKQCFVQSKDEEEAVRGNQQATGGVNPPPSKEPSQDKGSSLLVEHLENMKHPEETEPQWDLSIASFRRDVLMLLEDEEQKEKALEQLNLKVLKLSTAPIHTQEDTFYNVLYQLWQEAMDGLVSYSMWLREIMGLPEKETESSLILEETQSRKLNKKDDKKATDKKGKKLNRSAGKEDEREKRMSARKGKGKDDKKSVSPSSSKLNKQTVISKESHEHDQNQGDPITQRTYREKLYTEVYGLISSMMDDVSFLFGELKGQHPEPLDKCV